ncbi:hypothetical protein ACNKHK_08365 [Shigella flexneri]
MAISCCVGDGAAQRCFTAKERRLLNTPVAASCRRARDAAKTGGLTGGMTGNCLRHWGSQSLRNIEACAKQGYDALLLHQQPTGIPGGNTSYQVTSSDARDQRALDYALIICV